MKKILLLGYITILYSFFGCSSKQSNDNYAWLKHAIDVSAEQLQYTVNDVGDSICLPRSIWTSYGADFLCVQLEKNPVTFKDSLRIKPVKGDVGSRRYCFSIYDWTSGFFPGNLW